MYRWPFNERDLIAGLFPEDASLGSSTINIHVEEAVTGASVENTYTILWHKTYENWVPTGPPEEIFGDGYFSASSSVVQYPESFSGKFLHSSPKCGDWTYAANGAISFGAALTVPIPTFDVLYKSLLAGALLVVSDQAENISASWGDLWNSDKAQFPSGKNHPQSDYEVTVTVRQIDQQQAFFGDTYAANGYAGLIKKSTQVYKRREWVPTFRLINPSNSTPGSS